MLGRLKRWRLSWRLGAAFVTSTLIAFDAQAFSLRVQDPQGVVISQYRWLLEEDNTHDSQPGVPTPQGLGVDIHRSHAPVVKSGQRNVATANISVPDETKRYFISVLPSDGGYALGGAPIAPGQQDVTVVVQPLPLPTAQITVEVFHDNAPINNIKDAAESGLAGFKVVINDTFGQLLQDAFGNPLGNILTDAEGKVVIKNLAPGKYGVTVTPPTGTNWQQTSTIEGTKTIDAWVRAGEPDFFIENGPPEAHAFFGFVQPFADDTVLTGGDTIQGTVVNMHMARPPEFSFWPGHPIPSCWVGLNEGTGLAGRGLFAAPCAEDSSFSIPNVPPGDYQLVIWDANLDVIFATQNITVEGGGSCQPSGSCNLGDVAVFNWFARLENYVFADEDLDGFPDAGEVGIPEQNVNLRFRDGTIYQAFPTDMEGYAPFDEVFPFFKYLVAEVDFARFKATGMTVVVDGGGETQPANPDYPHLYPANTLNPQQQIDPITREILTNPNTDDAFSRTEIGPVLTQATQNFLGTTSVIHWGKAAYGPTENGGISGVVYYAVTRAEDDPRFAAADPWEPGIPRVQVALYADADDDGVIDDRDGDGAVTLADVDNHPLGDFPGPEDVDHNLNGSFDLGDAIQVVHTDAWDDNLPTGCPGEVGTQNPFYVHGNPDTVATDCFEGLRTYNQVRDAVFDGGYAFNDLEAGRYIVQAAVPPGYVLVREEDRNVDFGTSFEPTPQLLPPVCVGDLHRVRAELVLFPGVESPFARELRPLCDRKKVVLNDGANAAADFFMYTLVPKAARAVGFVLDDLGNEFDATSPAFGEKYGPPWLPIAIRDFTGHEISRVYTDEWGNYNFLVPSTFSANLPTTSGISPNMLRVCLNDPGPIPDPANPARMIQDPAYQPQYTRFCYTFNFTPGRTTYLDTPILPTAAYTGFASYPLDCEFGEGTPVIHSVSGPMGGPWLHTDSEDRQVTIVAQGPTSVPNPEYDQVLGNARTIVRDFGFGTTEGEVKIGNQVLPPQNVQWSAGQIVIDVPAGFKTGQLTVTRGDNGRSTEVGVTFTISNRDPIHVGPGGSIQAAIDAARGGDLILVPPGAYEERVVLYKRVNLQGWGAASTFIQNTTNPQGALDSWRDKVQRLFDRGRVALAEGQPGGTALLRTEESGAITVLAPATGLKNVRIDGFTLTSSGGDTGGGVFVNGYTDGLTISNNRIVSNRGIYGGGIRFGHMNLQTTPETRTTNINAKIHHNQVIYNSTGFGAGGAIALYAGTNNYAVTENFVCGNFSAAEGGGIGHLGRSENGLIANNRILFNESFNQLNAVNGGGVFVGGLAPFGEGSGSVTIAANIIQGNQAGAGDGGGIRAQYVDGPNVTTLPDALHIENNVITNNVAGMAGGGISLQDAVNTTIIHNTVAHNDSTATSGAAFPGNTPGVSQPRPSGIVSHGHSSALEAALAGTGDLGFSNPVLGNNIVWRNRSFWYDATEGGLLPDVENGADEIIADLAVIGVTGAALDPRSCLLTDVTGYEGAGNISGDPLFVNGYFNGSRNFSVSQGEFTTSLGTAIAFDEGGNYIDVSFGPLTPIGDYHIQPGSPAQDAGSDVFRVLRDVDDERRLPTRPLDMGADEIR